MAVRALSENKCFPTKPTRAIGHKRMFESVGGIAARRPVVDALVGVHCLR